MITTIENTSCKLGDVAGHVDNCLALLGDHFQHLREQNISFEVKVERERERCNWSNDANLRIKSELFGLGPLDALMINPDVTEILCLGHDRIFVECHGQLKLYNDQWANPTSYRNSIARISAPSRISTDHSRPFANGRYQDFRIHIASSPCTLDGPQLTLRRLSLQQRKYTLDKLLALDWCRDEGSKQLKHLVASRANFLVVGPTGSGKTTILNTLLTTINQEDRCLLLEDTDELALPTPSSSKLLTKQLGLKDDTTVDLTTLLSQALRMRPDRIVVGEVRGGEAKDLIMAFATGHRGCAGTLHAESTQEALLRLELLIQMGAPQWSRQTIQQLIKLAISAIIVVGKTESGQRKLKAIDRIASLEPSGFSLTRLYSANLLSHEIDKTSTRIEPGRLFTSGF